uniref:Glucosamine 6-phosphate N-acetyltransferase n=1 Tax=Phallusia mammillata TaxID=59560 RepID=A0A6F9DEN9_9ASCI|nr:glucosamine 6-phosphate N-acetyltransferase-like [Phallusia mammillata]
MTKDSESPVYIFDSKLLDDLDLSEYGIKFESNGLSPCKPEPGIIIRPLSTHDFDKGFTNVLSQLTRLGDVSKKDFLDRFQGMQKAGCYYPLVVEDTEANEGQGKIVGTGTLEIEQKFIHSCALRGRVEEIVIDSEYRGRKFGKLVLGLVTALSKKLNCYKTTLECKVENIPFYGIFNYKEDSEKFMQLRFRD